MFPEHRELISRLKTTDHHFAKLFDKHNMLDQKIQNMESGTEPGTHAEIEALKKDHGFLLKGGVFSEDFLDNYIDLKMGEYDAVRLRPHPYEFFLYFDI